MNKRYERLVWFLLAGCFAAGVQAAPRNTKGDGAAVQKLQGMIKSLTVEREAAKAEAAKVAAELEQLKKESAKNQADAEAAKAQLDNELATQKAGNEELRDRLDKAIAKLTEVIEKYKELAKVKNDLNTQLQNLQSRHQATEGQLAVCEEHNVKLYQAGKDLLEHYENKGTLGSLLQDEPVLQFQSVEIENIVQEYEDKLLAGQYKK